MSDLERRAEELKKELGEERGYTDGAALAALELIEQLLSENRQGEHAHIYTNYQGYVDELKSTIASLRQDLDRISAEREAYREALEPERLAQMFHEAYERLAPAHGYETRLESRVPWEQVPEPNRSVMIAVCEDLARRILAENDR